MSTLQREYSNQDWINRENYYTTSLTNLNLPPYPNGIELWTYAQQLDEIMSEVYMDKAFIHQAHEYYTTMKKLSEKEISVSVKVQEIQKGNTKVTVQEVDGLVVKHLKANPLPGMNISILDICSIMEKRKGFIDSCVDIIKKKVEMLATANTILSSDTKINIANNITQSQAQNNKNVKGGN